MAYQNIDATLSAADVQAVKDSFAEVLNKLPFLVNLTNAERRALTKAGPDSLSFVQNALATAEDNSAILPSTFDTAAFARDIELFAALSELQTVAESVTSQIDDTRLAVGSEAMLAATQTYQYVKTATKTTPGLRPAAEKLGERFQKTSRKKDPASSGGGTSAQNEG